MVYIDHTPAGTSTKNVIHWAQMVSSGKFCKYDYGSQNQEVYGQPTPPEYDISKVKIPTVIFYSENDWLADPQDVHDNIIKKIKNDTLKGINNLGSYNHLGRLMQNKV